MTKRNGHKTRKAILASVMSLLLSVSMFAGSTYAWFTDEVTSGVNQIIAGNLDVELYHNSTNVEAPIAEANKVGLDTKLFGTAFSAKLWEPGAIAVENFTVKNAGNLALKYKLDIVSAVYNSVTWGTDTTKYDLRDVIKVAVVDGSFTGDRAAAQALTYGAWPSATSKTSTLNAGASESFAVVLYWEPNDNAKDNLYNLKNGAYSATNTTGWVLDGTTSGNIGDNELFIEAGITLVATQLEYEKDSFDEHYDEGALYPTIAAPTINTTTSAGLATPATITASTTAADEYTSTVASTATTIEDSFAESTIPADTVATLKDESGNPINTLSSSLTDIDRNIETTNSSSDSVTYDISYNATVTTTTGTNTTTEQYPVHTFSKIVTNVLNIGSGLQNVKVTHNGTAMNELTTNTPTDNSYYYDSAAGKLYIYSSTYSLYTIEWTVPEYVARIGNVGYETLEAAVAAVKSGETITLLRNLTQENGVKFDKAGVSAKLDLDNYTFTVNNGSNINSRAIRIDNGTLEVFHGTIIAKGAGTNSSNGTGCYGAFRVEANGILNAHDLKLTNARPYGLNVKVLGGEAYLTNVTIESSYGGGIEVTEADLGTHSKTGYAELTNCNFTQNGYFDHCSSALSVSGGSKLVVNSGNYEGEYGLYVFSSGGEIEVKDGAFKANSHNVIKAEIDTNTYPQYTGGLKISGGEYTGTISVTSPAYMTVTGGTFSVDPSAYVADGYYANDNEDGTWTVSPGVGPGSGQSMEESGEDIE